MSRFVVALAALATALAPSASSAQDEVPEALRAWVPWVLADLPFHGCAARAGAVESDRTGDPLCAWPGLLEVTSEPGGGSFVLTVSLDREADVALPGSGRVLPIDVTVDGRPAVVLSEGGAPVPALDGGAPAVRAEAGEHVVRGRFLWESPPETLAVPSGIARVVLVEEGVRALAGRDASGAVWLRVRETEAVEEDRVTLEVHRRLHDGSPMALSTRIVVRVAGRARELPLGDILPEGAVPIDVGADLPARMLPTGELTLQLHAGEFTVTVEALVADPEAVLRRAELPEPWPAQEIWVWSPDERFRQVEVGGAPGIDPARTSLPADWRSHSAYVLDATSALTLTTRRRGESTPPPGSLALVRTVWLDERGTGFSVLDQLTLELSEARRIALAEGALGRMTVDGADQLITLGPDGRPGIEVRATSSSLSAEWRHEGAPSELPAVGWSEDARSSTASLNLPPGWQLLHASGVDRAPSTWVAQWTLLGFFALLVIAAAVGRVMGWPWGLLAFAGVGLTFHDPGAPQWVWLTLAVLLALHRALAGRRFERWIRWAYLACVAIATVMTVVFAASQLREAHYPQLATPTNDGSGSYGGDDWDDGVYDARSTSAPAVESLSERRSAEMEGGMGRGSGAAASAASDRYSSAWIDPNAVVQTGFGTPTWTWSQYELSFDGPVSREHRIGLWLSPPWLTRLLSLLRAVVTLALLALALRKRPLPPSGEGAPAAPGPVAAPIAAALALLCLAAPVEAQGFPPPELLTALRERLAAPPDCDRCAEANRITVGVEGDRLTVELEVSVAAATAYPLPGPSETWVPETTTLDGRPAGALVRLGSGFLHARLPVGVHTLRLEGPLGGRDAITLAFGRAPRALVVEAEGWEVDGLAAESVPASIQLRRLASEGPTADGEAPTRSVLPTWLEVERHLELGVRWTLASTVRRRSPGDAPAVVRIPLLPGESVNSANVTVENGEALVTLGQTDAEVSWSSTLAPAETITLTAPNAGLLSEVWVLACSPLWHCETSGLHPTVSGSDGRWEPRFDPWPGESLTVTTGRPEASEGRSTTLERATLTVQPGVRLTTSTLEVGARTSVSSTLRITVPSGAEVRSLSVDGASRALQREGDALAVALTPGPHTVTLELQESRGWAFSYPTPAVTLGDAAVNLELIVEGSSDRWLLWIDGPAWGPAVLFWPYLALVLVLAVALSRRRSLAPRLHDWALLLVGLTQIPAVAALLVVGWFFLLEHRRDTKLAHPVLFALRQLVVVGATFVAAGLLLWAIESGLLGAPQMDIQGPGCWDQHLRFFVDRSDGALPVATLFSVPTWVFRVLMFCWALWLAFSVLRWARWGWDAFRTDGLFRPTGGAPAPAAPSVPAPSEAAPSEAAPSDAASAAPAATGEPTPPPEPPAGPGEPPTSG